MVGLHQPCGFDHEHTQDKLLLSYFCFQNNRPQLGYILKEFEEGDKSIALQIVSGREGISLRQASALVYYNIDFSATSYWQSRDRMTTKDRTESDIYWVFAEKGIETQVYKAVTEKKDYTLNHFKKWNTKMIFDTT